MRQRRNNQKQEHEKIIKKRHDNEREKGHANTRRDKSKEIWNQKERK